MKPGLRAALASGSPVVGSWLTMPEPAIAEILARAGYAFLTVDLEHSALDLSQAAALIRTAQLAGSTPLVRLSSNDPVQIKRVMDAGAHGIIVPMVKSGADVAAAHAAMHYPPTGVRGVGLSRAQGYGQDFHAYRSWLEQEAVLVAQVEHIDALDHLDDILGHPGLHATMLGPYDLSASMGLPGRFDHPDVVDAIRRVREAADRHGIPAGTHVVEPDPAQLRLALDQGHRMVAYSVDFRMLAVAARAGLAAL